MILEFMTSPEVELVSRDTVVVIPTGSLEQHGPHLPLFTDTLLATAVAKELERSMPQDVLLTPGFWLGASSHHLAFCGTLSNSSSGYLEALKSLVESLATHGFYRFYLLNGHGGNTDLNSLALRELKQASPHLQLGHSGTFAFAGNELAAILEGPLKEVRHACEAETSLMMHLFPKHVRTNLLADDGLFADPPVRGMVWTFAEQTCNGSFGYASLASAEKGKRIFEAILAGLVSEMRNLRAGVVLRERPRA